MWRRFESWRLVCTVRVRTCHMHSTYLLSYYLLPILLCYTSPCWQRNFHLSFYIRIFMYFLCCCLLLARHCMTNLISLSFVGSFASWTPTPHYLPLKCCCCCGFYFCCCRSCYHLRFRELLFALMACSCVSRPMRAARISVFISIFIFILMIPLFLFAFILFSTASIIVFAKHLHTMPSVSLPSVCSFVMQIK